MHVFRFREFRLKTPIYAPKIFTGATCAREEETKRDKERNLSFRSDDVGGLTVANWVFAETSHVVGSK